jgi:hypothetical protein
MPFDPLFPGRIEYPKWVCGMLAADAAEERAIRTAAAAEVEAAEAMALRPAAKLLLPTLAEAIANPEPTPQTVPARATPLEPEPSARLASSATPPGGIIAVVAPMPIAAQPARPSSSGERMRRMRERQRGGRRTVLLDVTPIQVEALVQAGLLDASRRDDVGEIARGIGRLLDRNVTPASPR